MRTMIKLLAVLTLVITTFSQHTTASAVVGPELRIELSPRLNPFQQLLATRQAATLWPATQSPASTRLSASTPGAIPWQETIPLPIASSAPFNDARGQQLIFHNGYVYIFGGASAGEPRLTNVYFSAIGQDGSLAGWVETTSLPGSYYDHVVIKVGEYVYLLTGADGAEDVYYAPFNADGSIGAWRRTASLSPSRQQFAAVSHGNFIYTTGGNSGGNQAFVQYTSVGPDGSLNAWTFTTPLPAAIQAHTMIAYNGYLYVFGGKNASDRWVTAVYFSAINENGSLAGWETTTSLPRQMSGYSTFESNGYVYLVGGSSSSSYYTRILENHTLDIWEEATSLPNTNIHGLRTGAYNGFAYAMGGYKGGYQRTVYYGFIGSIPAPGAATLRSPSGAITDTTPEYSWNKVSGAEWYYLYVSGPSGYVFANWYQSDAVCGASTCSVANATTLSGGTYRWWIQTWNEAGYGPWSTGMSFTVNAPPPPGAATLTSPSGNITTNNPTYTWNKISAATWYYLYLSGPSGYVFTQWYLASNICGASTCSVANATTLGVGEHRWWVQTWNGTGGYGPWSTGLTFTTSLPAAATLNTPNGVTTSNPTYTWNKVPAATWYNLYLSGPSGYVFTQWYRASDVCGVSTCSLPGATPGLASGQYRWWIQTWNNVGYGPWSTGLNFTVSP